MVDPTTSSRQPALTSPPSPPGAMLGGLIPSGERKGARGRRGMGRERGDYSWTRRGFRGKPVPQFRCCRARREQCGSRSREHVFRCEAEEWFLDRRGRLGCWSGSKGDLPAGKSRRAGREPGWCSLLLARGREGEGQSRMGHLLLLRPLSPPADRCGQRVFTSQLAPCCVQDRVTPPSCPRLPVLPSPRAPQVWLRHLRLTYARHQV